MYPHLPAKRALLWGLLVILATGCTSSQPRNADADLPDDFRVVIGEGGGFTGAWEGYAFEPDGTIFRWKDDPENRTHRAGSLTRRQRDELWGRVEQSGYFSLDHQETGNMTVFLRIAAGQRDHRVSWVPSQSSTAPAAAVSLHAYCLKLAREAGGT